MSFTDDLHLKQRSSEDLAARLRQVEVGSMQAHAIRKELERRERSRYEEPEMVRGKGTAYPVGSEKHQEPEGDISAVDGTPEPVFHEIGPVDVPQPGGVVELNAEFTDEHLAGLVLRACRLDPKYWALAKFVGGKELIRVQVHGVGNDSVPVVITGEWRV